MQNNKPKFKLEEILTKPVRGIGKFVELEDFSNQEMMVMMQFLSGVSNAPSPSKTLSVLMAWSEMSDNDQHQLLEHFSRHQIVMIGLAFCCVVEARTRGTGLDGLFKHLFGDFGLGGSQRREEEENPDGDEHEKD